MARDRKTFDDDDGRTVADMSGVSRPNLWGFRYPSSAPAGGKEPDNREEPQQDRPWDTSGQLTRRERWHFILGALSAALLIALPFAIVFAVAIYIIGHGLF
ncbi:MAG: hypothetical protein II069_00735 [Oscillospiraceae bacterium]|nr:hypothetical protein [Oscillospiraceae bacterium]